MLEMSLMNILSDVTVFCFFCLQIEIFERSYFTGKSRILTSNIRDFMTRVDRQQGAFMYSVGSLKVRGGM